MKTSKPISTICYLSADALNLRLERLRAEHGSHIAYACFIPHKAEKEGQKDHIHLLIVPSGTLDTEALWFREMWLTEYEGNTVSAVKPWTNSKIADALLYFSHNEQYLMKKGLDRKYHYFDTDFFTTDAEWFAEEYEQALALVRTPIEKMYSCIEQGLTPFQAMAACGCSYGSMKAFLDTYTQFKNFIYENRKENSNV